MTTDANAWLRAVLHDHQDRSRVLLAAYKAIPASRLNACLLIEDRCRYRCLLLRCWQGGGRTYVYLPAYKLSPARNEATSNPDARKKRTLDGDRHWPDSVVELADLDGAGAGLGLPMKCDHLDTAVPVADILQRVAAARPGRPDRRVVSA